jgi:RNA polymerase sigma-70 factor (ECF subfamily)
VDEVQQREAWLRSARAGDRQAFEHLLTPYLPRLYRLAHQLTRDPVDAEDILQDSVIKAFRSFSGFRQEAELYTWLARIVRNTVLDDFKRAVRRYEEAHEVMPEHVEHVTEPRAERDELRGLVRSLVDQLSDKLREPLVLYDLEGYSYEEVAAILDLNLGTVKSRLNRARLALRERIVATPHVLEGYLPLAFAAQPERT